MRSLSNDRRRAQLVLRAAARADAGELRWLLASRAWRGLRDTREALQRRLNFRGAHTFADRSRGAEQALVVLAGYKSYLWPYTLERLARIVPAGVDACVASPGMHSPQLEAFAARAGWSYLSTRDNDVALAQNLAIIRHPAARWVHKVDEDIVLARDHFSRMLDGYRRVAGEGRFTPGFCAPLLNVNGYSYRPFLERLGLEDAYAARFGELRQAGDGVRAHSDGAAARWLWERTLPFDEVARRVGASPFAYSAVPHRFSIGAILLERSFWEEIGGFLVVPRGGLGHDEEDLCEQCVTRSRVGVVLHDVLAGHFSFGPQERAMREALPDLAPGLALEGAPVNG